MRNDAEIAYPHGRDILLLRRARLVSTRDKKYAEFTARLRRARLSAGFTQRQVARSLGKPQSFVSRSESGERRVDIIELAEFARLYQIDLGQFLPTEPEGTVGG